MARLQSTSQQFRVAMQATEAQVRAAIVRTARAEHERVMSTDPRPGSYYQIVDGVRDAPLEAVKAIAIFRYPRLDQVAAFALETLFDLSPVDDDLYRRSHTLFLNGREVADLADYAAGDDVTITNYVPYARKIEVGAMTMRVAGTDRVYQQARRKVMARWGNVANIRFTFRAIIAGAQVNAAQFPANLKRRGAKGRFAASGGVQAHNQANLRFPVLEISER